MSVTTRTTTLPTGHAVIWADDDAVLRIGRITHPDGSVIDFPGAPHIGACLTQGFPPECVPYLIDRWAKLRELTRGPWIWATQAAVVTLDTDNRVIATRCPAVACGLMPKVIDGRIAAHDNITRTQCDWTGVRIILDYDPTRLPTQSPAPAPAPAPAEAATPPTP